MTTISIRPVREARERDFGDCSTFDQYLLGNARIVSSNTLPSSGAAIRVYGGREFGWQINLGVELKNSEWLKSTLKAMESLPWEKDNWTTGGTRTQRAAVANMLSLLAKILGNRTPPPNVVPTWRGGVQVEWHRNNVHFEIEADPRGEIEYFFKSPTEEREGQAWEDISGLVKYAQAVTISE